jgi:hypothetical protein
MKIPPYHPNIPTGSPSGGGSAGISLADKDRARGLTPGDASGGTAGFVPGKREPLASGKREPLASGKPGPVFQPRSGKWPAGLGS